MIDVEDSLYLAGHNGSGKSSVLDAIQIVLVADLGRVRFNSSAQERSARNLDSYVRGKIGEGRLLRPGNTVAYVALEFTDTRKDMRTTLGVCIECAEGRTPERTYVILTGTLDPSLFMIDGRERSRRELRQALRARPHAHAFDTIGEYRDEMLNRLGGLNERFFDLFLRALTFQPITNINEFVEQWLLSEAPLDLVTLQRVVERLQDLQRSAVEVEAKVEALRAIDDQQREVCRLHDRHDEYTILAALLRVVAAEQHLTALAARIATMESDLTRDDAELTEARTLVKGAGQARVEAEVRLRQSDVVRRRDELERAVRTANREAGGIRERWQALRHALQQEARAVQPLLQPLLAERHELAAADERALHALVTHALALSSDDPPPAELASLVEATILVLDKGLRAAQEELFTLERQTKELRQQGQELERELAHLRENGRTYPRDVERVRDLLAPVVGAQPPLLCELLEIPDERWPAAREHPHGAARVGAYQRCAEQARIPQRTLPFPLPPHGGCP